MIKKNRPNFKLLEKMNDDITALKNRQTDLNHNTNVLGINIIVHLIVLFYYL